MIIFEKNLEILKDNSYEEHIVKDQYLMNSIRVSLEKLFFLNQNILNKNETKLTKVFFEAFLFYSIKIYKNIIPNYPNDSFLDQIKEMRDTFAHEVVIYEIIENNLVINHIDESLSLHLPKSTIDDKQVNLNELLKMIFYNINLYVYSYLTSTNNNHKQLYNEDIRKLTLVSHELCYKKVLIIDSHNTKVSNLLNLCISISKKMQDLGDSYILTNILFESFCYQYKKIITIIDIKLVKSILFKDLNKIRNSLDHSNLLYTSNNNEIMFHDFEKDTDVLYNSFYIARSGKININNFFLFHLSLLNIDEINNKVDLIVLNDYLKDKFTYDISFIKDYLKHRNSIYIDLKSNPKVLKLKEAMNWFNVNNRFEQFEIDLFHVYRHLGFELVLGIKDLGNISTKKEAEIYFEALKFLLKSNDMMDKLEVEFDFIYLYKKSLYINISDIYRFYGRKTESLVFAEKAKSFLLDNPNDINNEIDLIRVYGNIANTHAITTSESPASYDLEKYYIKLALELVDNANIQGYTETNELKFNLIINYLASCSSLKIRIEDEYMDFLNTKLSQNIEFHIKKDILINLGLYYSKIGEYSNSITEFRKVSKNKKIKQYDRIRADLYILLNQSKLNEIISIKKIKKISNLIINSNDLLEDEKSVLLSLIKDLTKK